MNVIEHYKAIGVTAIEILDQSLQDEENDLMIINHSFIFDFSLWLDVLKDRPEISIFENAIKEYQMSILSNNMGLYQQAFMGLRFFLERTLVAILFSANEIELNLWKLGERDTYWSELIDDEKGIFSSKFCKAFFPELKDEIKHFSAITKKVYRECSEYVHGNQSILDKIPSDLGYSADVFHEWNTKADTIKRIILFTFCLRYLRGLQNESVRKVEPSLSEEFKTITPIIEIIIK